LKLRIAGAQLPVTTDIDANLEAILRAVDFAVDQDADVLLTPEGSLSGYTALFDHNAVAEALDVVTGCAADKSIGLALGTCFVESDGKCYNQIRFYDPDGTFLGFHSKILRCGSMDEPPKGEINDYAVVPLRTFDLCGVKVGGLICNDMWANPGCTPVPDPHLSQHLSRMGARVIFQAVNGGRGPGEWSKVAWNYHESNLRMRANAGRVWVVVADNCHPMELPCSCPSGVINPEGSWVCQALPQGEQLFIHDLIM